MNLSHIIDLNGTSLRDFASNLSKNLFALFGAAPVPMIEPLVLKVCIVMVIKAEAQ